MSSFQRNWKFSRKLLLIRCDGCNGRYAKTIIAFLPQGAQIARSSWAALRRAIRNDMMISHLHIKGRSWRTPPLHPSSFVIVANQQRRGMKPSVNAGDRALVRSVGFSGIRIENKRQNRLIPSNRGIPGCGRKVHTDPRGPGFTRSTARSRGGKRFHLAAADRSTVFSQIE